MSHHSKTSFNKAVSETVLILTVPQGKLAETQCSRKQIVIGIVSERNNLKSICEELIVMNTQKVYMVQYEKLKISLLPLVYLLLVYMKLEHKEKIM